MTLKDIKIETNKAYTKDCVYISESSAGYRSCVSDKCFYWNDLDTHEVLANYIFTHTVVQFPDFVKKIGYYAIRDGVLKYIKAEEFNQETEEKEAVDQEKNFKFLISDPKADKNECAKIYFNKETQKFMQKNDRDKRIGYCMKVAKELELI